MKVVAKLAAVVAVSAPALTSVASVGAHPGNGKSGAQKPGPTATMPAKVTA